MGLRCLSNPFWQAISVPNFRTFIVDSLTKSQVLTLCHRLLCTRDTYSLWMDAHLFKVSLVLRKVNYQTLYPLKSPK